MGPLNVEEGQLIIQPLTEETFAPYGRLLGKPRRAADIEKHWMSYWHCLADLDFKVHPVWGFLEVRHREPLLTELERHCRAAEVFIPMGGLSIMPFALGGTSEESHAEPDPQSIRLFLLDGSQAFIVERGVWHTPAFAVGESAGFLLALEEGTPHDDLDIRSVGPFSFDLMKFGDK